MNNNDQGGKFVNGFLLGALIGAGIVFLLGTKKGKRLLKNLSEDGLGNITDILEQAGELENDDMDVEGAGETEETNGTESNSAEAKGEMKYPVQKPLIRRFFRRSKNP